MELSIILINYNTKNLISKTIASIFQTVLETKYEIIVADNSSDEEQRYHSEDKRVRVLPPIENKGFSNACNLAAKKAKAPYLLFLNSDAILKVRSVDESLAYLKQQNDVGALGIRMLSPDGTLDHGCKRGFPTPMASFYYFTGMDKRHPDSEKYGWYRQTFIKDRTIADVDSISGAFFMIPTKIFKEMNGFDEDYFMYGEDLDLCYRIKQAGYRVVYYGKVFFIHLKGESGMKKDPETLTHFYGAMHIFYNKHYQSLYKPITSRAVHAAIQLKYKLAAFKAKKRG